MESFQILQYYRHDLINEIQLVQAYLSMNNYDKVKDKMDEIIANFHKERYLIGLQTPKFVFWVLQFNHVYANINLTYDINVADINLSLSDDELVDQCNRVTKTMKKFLNETKLYNIHLQIEEKSELEMQLILCLNGVTKQRELMKALLEERSEATVYVAEQGITYIYVFIK